MDHTPGTASAVPKAQTMKWDGSLITSFQLMGSLHFSLELSGYPDVGQTNVFFERLKGKQVRVIVEEVQP